MCVIKDGEHTTDGYMYGNNLISDTRICEYSSGLMYFR
jgi:hypothetical protein